MPVLLLHSGADAFVPPPGTTRAEEDGWWNGVGQIAVSIALAAGVALGATACVSVQRAIGVQDDLGNLHLKPVVDEDFSGPLPAPQLWWIAPPAVSDDGTALGNLHAFPVLDAEYLAPLPAPQLWPTAGIVQWGDPSDRVAPSTSFGTDEIYQVVLPAPSLWPLAGPAFADDGTALGNLHLTPTVDEDFPGPLPAPVVWFPPLQAVTDDDGNSLGNLHAFPAVDEDYSGPFPMPQLWPVAGLVSWGEANELPQIQGEAEVPVPLPAPQLWPTSGGVFGVGGDEVPTTPPSLGTDADYLVVLPAPVVWAPPLQAQSDDGNDLGNLHAFPALVEDGAPTLGAWTLASPVQAVADEGDFVAPAATIVEDSGYQPVVLGSPWVVLQPWGDDAYAPQPIGFDEGVWQNPVAPVVWFNVLVQAWQLDASNDLPRASYLALKAYDESGARYVVEDRSGGRYTVQDLGSGRYLLTDMSGQRYLATDLSRARYGAEDTQ